MARGGLLSSRMDSPWTDGHYWDGDRRFERLPQVDRFEAMFKEMGWPVTRAESDDVTALIVPGFTLFFDEEGKLWRLMRTRVMR